MPRDSGGTYTLPAGNPVAADTLIDAAWANSTLADIGNEMSNTLHKDGRVAMTGPLVLSTRGSPLDTDAASWANILTRINTRVGQNFPNLGTSQAFRVQNKSGNYTAVAGDFLSVLNFTANATLTLLPAATAGAGFVLWVQAASGVSLTIDGDGSESIDGQTTFSVSSRGRAMLVCDGSNWAIHFVQSYAATQLIRCLLNSPREASASTGGVTGAVAVDLNNQNILIWTLTGNVTISFSNPPTASQVLSITFVLTQDGTGGRTITWPAAVKWPGGVGPTLSGANKQDVITLITWDGGTSYLGFVAGQNY